MEISVIICTYNPIPEHFRRTLNGLKNQDYSLDKWELIIVDNKSEHPISSKDWDIDWHPNLRIVREENLGLTHARVRGIDESKGKVLVYVDDDLVLKENFLRLGLEKAGGYPFLGIWGGKLEPDFEVEPPKTILPHMQMLGVHRPIDRVIYSNLKLWTTTPSGAGMILRRDVALKYSEETKSNSLKQFLSRKGDSLSSGGEVDVAYTAIDLGYACGLFPDLSAVHIIPKKLLTEEYIIRLHEAVQFSSLVVARIRGDEPKEYSKPKLMLLRKIYHHLNGNKFNFRIYEGTVRAHERADKLFKELEKDQKIGAWELHSLRL